MVQGFIRNNKLGTQQMSFWGVLPEMRGYPRILVESILPLKLRAKERIGPHNQDIVSILVGSLLGDGYLERHGNGCRQCFQQEQSNRGYLLAFYHYLSARCYTTSCLPKITRRIGTGGKLRYVSRFKTYTFASFNWFHEEFYKENKKQLPNKELLFSYITPQSLAVWIMDDGSRSGKGLKLSTNCFTYEENLVLANILRKKYFLKISIHKTGYVGQYSLYIHKGSVKDLYNIVKDSIHPSMKYKFNSI